MSWRSVRATAHERARRLPGDELIPNAGGSLTHAITIHRPAADVWAWLAQMGAGSRAGWYSYDFVDNGRRRSADRILPELQNIAVGTLFPALPGVTDGFHVMQLETGVNLVLGWVLSPGAPPAVTWTFALEQRPDGATRLITRARGGPAYRFLGLPPALSRLAIAAVHFVMERRQLLGIARRAEASPPVPNAAAHLEAA